MMTDMAGSAPRLRVKLHPLVLLTITDFVTRHTLTKNTNKLLGVVLGDQEEHTLSMRHAFEGKTAIPQDHSDAIGFDETWVKDRIQQYRDVHKAPALDPVAAFMVGSSDAALTDHHAALQQLQAIQGSRPVLLLVFHPDLIADGTLLDDQLPVSIYRPQDLGNPDGGFTRVDYEVDTDEAELVGLGFVAAGAANAKAVQVVTPHAHAAAKESSQSGVLSPGRDGKAAQAATSPAPTTTSQPISVDGGLSNQDEEVIASMTAQYNAVKMLRDRLSIIRTYLNSIPPCHITNPSLPISSGTLSEKDQLLLRDISALLSRLPLLSNAHPSLVSKQPADSAAPPSPNHETQESADVALTTLLTALTRSAAAMSELNRKHNIVSRIRNARNQHQLLQQSSTLLGGITDSNTLRSGFGTGSGTISGMGAARKRGALPGFGDATGFGLGGAVDAPTAASSES